MSKPKETVPSASTMMGEKVRTLIHLMRQARKLLPEAKVYLTPEGLLSDALVTAGDLEQLIASADWRNDSRHHFDRVQELKDERDRYKKENERLGSALESMLEHVCDGGGERPCSQMWFQDVAQEALEGK